VAPIDPDAPVVDQPVEATPAPQKNEKAKAASGNKADK